MWESQHPLSLRIRYLKCGSMGWNNKDLNTIQDKISGVWINVGEITYIFAQ
jgi:hypothetical protein